MLVSSHEQNWNEQKNFRRFSSEHFFVCFSFDHTNLRKCDLDEMLVFHEENLKEVNIFVDILQLNDEDPFQSQATKQKKNSEPIVFSRRFSCKMSTKILNLLVLSFRKIEILFKLLVERVKSG